jgi:hypothetical protein
MKIQKQKLKRIEITIGEIEDNQKNKTKSLSVYDTTLDKVVKIISKALEQEAE